jgi:hypothetical protein
MGKRDRTREREREREREGRGGKERDRGRERERERERDGGEETVAFHARRDVDRITEKAASRHQIAYSDP